MENLLAIGTLGGSRQTQKHLGLQMVEQPSVRICLGMVELVNDHDVELRRVELVDRAAQRLDRREHVIPMDRPLSRDETLAERLIVQDEPEHLLALLEDFVAMRDE